MSAVWLILYLGSLVHLLTLNGYGLKHPASALLLLPVAAALLLPALLKRHQLPSGLVRGAGLAGFAGALLFVKAVYLEGWDCQEWGPALAMTLAGLGSLLPTLATPSQPGPGTWLWVAFWLGTGRLDPALPLLGAGLGGMLEGSGLGLGESSSDAPGANPGWTLFLLGLALPKPWWDFGIEPGWAWASASVGLGAALAALPRLGPWLDRLPSSAPAWLLAALAVLYAPGPSVPWGALLGLAVGAAWRRFPRPLPLDRATALFLLGLLVSFALHANLWIPGLRHLIWLGN